MRAGWARLPATQNGPPERTAAAKPGGHPTTLSEQATFSRLWSATARRSPLCDQAAVEHEANEWAEQWNENGHYPDCFTGMDLPPPLPATRYAEV